MPPETPAFNDLLRLALDGTAASLAIANLGRMLNERYLHHFMSHRFQEQFALLDLHTSEFRQQLHPEWPTWKKSTGIRFGQYKSENVEGINKKKTRKYFPVTKTKGGAGFLDFTLGDYACPTVAIELTTKFGWAHEEVVYDLMKLIDGRNRSFKAVVSCNLILREKGLAEAGKKTRLKRNMETALKEAKERLDIHLCDDDRELFFVASEISPSSRRHWFYRCENDEFIESENLPPFLVDSPKNNKD